MGVGGKRQGGKLGRRERREFEGILDKKGWVGLKGEVRKLSQGEIWAKTGQPDFQGWGLAN